MFGLQPWSDSPAGSALSRWRWLGGQCAVCRQWTRRPLCEDCRSAHAAPVRRCRGCGLRKPLAGAAALVTDSTNIATITTITENVDTTTAVATDDTDAGRPAPWCCAACRHRPPVFEAVVVGVDYGFPWDRLIAEFKFRDRTDLAAPLADLIVASAGPAPAADTMLVPVPLSSRRLAERGYNQAACLARALAARLALPLDERSLSRPVDAAHQAALGRRERLQNLRHSFLVEPGRQAALAGRRVLLVDDVMTTGATLMAAAHELRRAGATAVQAWVVARTP